MLGFQADAAGHEGDFSSSRSFAEELRFQREKIQAAERQASDLQRINLQLVIPRTNCSRGPDN